MGGHSCGSLSWPCQSHGMDPTDSTRDGHGPGNTAWLLSALLGTAGLRVQPDWGRDLSALGEQINTHCTSLDSCSAHGHRAITLTGPSHVWPGQGHHWVGIGTALWGRDRQGVPGWHQWARGQGPSQHARAGSTPGARYGRKGWTGASCLAAMGHWPCSPQCPPCPGRGEAGAAKSFPHLYLK